MYQLVRVNEFMSRGGLPNVVCTIPEASGYQRIIFPTIVGDMLAASLFGRGLIAILPLCTCCRADPRHKDGLFGYMKRSVRFIIFTKLFSLP
jgi:hypothetical protein